MSSDIPQGKKYTVLGLMSGTSLDGLDLALCDFWYDGKWNFQVLKTQTVPYPQQLAKSLRGAARLSALELVTLHKDYGRFLAQKINKFLSGAPKQPVLIASHGHTVFHYPEAGINFQIGDGAVINALTGLPVVCDFRSQDIALGGQGAPLVPTGDLLLFDGYDLLLNLGGFSNVTVKNPFLAFDICPVNYALNYFARHFGMDFDRDGSLGQKGEVNSRLLEELNALEYYAQEPPKSLSDHWFYDEFLPITEKYKIPLTGKLRTIYEHIAQQIATVLDKYGGKVLVTGGGAKNKFLIRLIREKTKAQIIIPGPVLVDYKEALIFAFLGLLRYLGKTNVDRRITGAARDTVSGALYG